MRRASKTTWAAFVKSKMWDNDKARPKLDQQNEAVRFVMLVYEEGNSRRTKEASDVFLAVEHLLGSKMSDDQVVQAMRDCPSVRTILDESRQKATSHGKTKPPIKKERNAATELAGKAKAASTNTAKAKKPAPPARRRAEDYKDTYPTNLVFAPNEKRFAALPNGTKVRFTAVIDDAGRVLNVKKLKVV